MVDPISNNANVNSLIRAQSLSVANLKTNQELSQAIVNKTQKPAIVPVSTSSVTQGAKLAGASSNLPRGSLVDVLA